MTFGKVWKAKKIHNQMKTPISERFYGKMWSPSSCHDEITTLGHEEIQRRQ